MNEWLRPEYAYSLARALFAVFLAVVVALALRSAMGRLLRPRISAQFAMLAQRVVFYVVLGLGAVAALQELGFDLTVLLGAAGVVSVAIGFASQTSASNLISGLFLISEQPFVVGNVIRVGNTTGEVLSIDLLSVKLRTFDNLFVRVPNETLIKAEITNLTRFPIRRYDLQVGVAYKEEIGRVREILFEVASRNPLCLREPKPLIIFQGFADSAVSLQLSVWSATKDYLELRNRISEEVKAAFEREGVEIPFPHLSLYAGSATSPIPVRSVETESPAPA